MSAINPSINASFKKALARLVPVPKLQQDTLDGGKDSLNILVLMKIDHLPKKIFRVFWRKRGQKATKEQA